MPVTGVQEPGLYIQPPNIAYLVNRYVVFRSDLNAATAAIHGGISLTTLGFTIWSSKRKLGIFKVSL